MSEDRPGSRFPRSGRLRSGYAVDQVERFLHDVEHAVTTPGLRLPAPAEIRRAGFDMVRNGYEPHAVDAALDRLEQRALEEEQEAARSRGSDGGPTGDAGGTAGGEERLWAEVAAVRAELERPAGSRFPRAGRFERGYATSDVDQLCERLAGVLSGGPGPGVRGVRSAVFRAQRGGYAELPVDDLLDRVVEILLRRSVAS